MMSISYPRNGLVIRSTLICSIISAIIGATVGAVSARISTNTSAALTAKDFKTNPLILKDAISSLNKYEQEKANNEFSSYISKNYSEIFRDSLGNFSQKPSKAVVEFIDYNCSVCKSSYSELSEKLPGVEIIVRQAPILGPDSVFAAKGAILAASHGRFDEYHDSLMRSKSRLSKAQVLSTLNKIGIQSHEIDADINKKEIEEALKSDEKIRIEMGIEGTPTFITNKKIIYGYSLKDIKSSI